MNRIFFLLFLIVLAGCAIKPIKPIPETLNVIRTVEPVEVLHPPLPQPISWKVVTFKVLTPDIIKEFKNNLETGIVQDRDVVFMALTPEAYEALSENMANIKRYIADQKEIIIYYRTTVPKEILLPQEEIPDEIPIEGE